MLTHITVKSACKQSNFHLPLFLFCFLFSHLLHHAHSRHAPGEEVDTDDSLEEVGEEWPDFEEPSVARQREFHQVSPSCTTHSYITSCCQINQSVMLIIVSRYSLPSMHTHPHHSTPHVVLVWSGTGRLPCWPANSHSGSSKLLLCVTYESSMDQEIIFRRIHETTLSCTMVLQCIVHTHIVMHFIFIVQCTGTLCNVVCIQ